MKSAERRVVIVTRATRFENILAKENTISQARFKMKSLNAVSQSVSKTQERYTDFELYENEHNIYQAAIRTVRGNISRIAPVQMLNRQHLPNFVFADTDVVVCIGQDGLVANTIKYLSGQPVIGINPDSAAYDGVLLPFTPQNALPITAEVLKDKRQARTVSMGEARLPDGQSLLAVNDFFIGKKSHVSARYIIKYGGIKEPQSSSGIIVSTGLGSTGWMKSVLAGARGVNAAVLGTPYKQMQNERLVEEDMDSMMMKDRPVRNQAARRIGSVSAAEKSAFGRQPMFKQKKEFGASDLSSVIGNWESKELLFAVREPFPSKTSGTSIVFGKVDAGHTLRIESLMGEEGVIFSDGIEADFLEFNSGMEASIGIAKKTGLIIV